MAEKPISVSKTFASLASLSGECASEFETRVYLSSEESRQFIGGSEDRPVSRATICLEYSPKHSSMESKPDFEPKTENQGVQICAGIKNDPWPTSNTISSRSLLASPRIGRPSDLIFPIRAKRPPISAAASRDGTRIRL